MNVEIEKWGDGATAAKGKRLKSKSAAKSLVNFIDTSDEETTEDDDADDYEAFSQYLETKEKNVRMEIAEKASEVNINLRIRNQLDEYFSLNTISVSEKEFKITTY